MAQAQATRGDQHLKAAQQEQPEAIQYGHVFAVTGDLAVQPIAPRDAEAMRSAEDSVPGVPVPQASGGGFSAAVAMETAAAYNQAVGAVNPGQASAAATMKGITVTQTAVPGGRVVTEFVAGQVVGQYSVADQAMMEQSQRQQQVVEEDTSKVTIGEAMEAAALSAGERPVEEADAAAIRAAETQAQGEDGAPDSLELAHFRALLLYEAASDGRAYDEVITESERGLSIKVPSDPAPHSHSLCLPAPDLDYLRAELRTLIQKANLASISLWVKTLGGPGDDKVYDFFPMPDDSVELHPLPAAPVPRWANEIKKATKTPEERRKEVEVQLAAMRLVEQQQLLQASAASSSPPQSEGDEDEPPCSSPQCDVGLWRA